MSSTIEITKTCQWCGATFIARKCTTRFCCKRCSELAYKQHRRTRHVATQQEIASSANNLSELQFLSPSQCATLLGVSRRTIYRYLASNKIRCCQFAGCTRIKREDVDSSFNSGGYQIRQSRIVNPIEEYYTTREILDKFGISNSWLFKMAKIQKIPKKSIRGKTYWSKRHIDNVLVKQLQDLKDRNEWYSVEEACAKFNMSKEAVYRFVSARQIGKSKEKSKVYYSRREFDREMKVETGLEPEFYTMPEAMTRFNMTRDQISHYVRTHNIPRTYECRYVRINRKALDSLFATLEIC